jgi:predicted nucleotidyltransferase component of viral defense system
MLDHLPHEEPEQFLAALGYTASKTGFSARLIEKDYFCSLILRELKPLFDRGLVFKGGTSLSKVYAGFHRLSEDLDFAISIDGAATQSTRREAIKDAKAYVHEMVERVVWIVDAEPLTGANRSAQYNGVCIYKSCATGEQDAIKIEIGLREPVLEMVETRPASTILMNPFDSKCAIEPFPIVAMSLRESYAEKIRAALSRREPAIRDLFDLHHAIDSGILDVGDPGLLALTKRKMLVNVDEPANVSDDRFGAFRRQVEAALRPVLREKDFADFHVEQIFGLLRRLNEQLAVGDQGTS